MEASNVAGLTIQDKWAVTITTAPCISMHIQFISCHWTLVCKDKVSDMVLGEYQVWHAWFNADVDMSQN